MKKCITLLFFLYATVFWAPKSHAQYFFTELTDPSGVYNTEVLGEEWVEIEIKTGMQKPLLVKLEYNFNNADCYLVLYGKAPGSASSLFSLWGPSNDTFTTIIYDTGGDAYNAYLSLQGLSGNCYGTLKITYSHLDQDLSNFYLSYGYDLAGNRTSVNIQEIVLKNSSNANIDEDEPLTDDLFGVREIKIYPNPTKGDLNILIQNGEKDEKYQYLLFDLNGRKLMEFTYSGNGTVPLNLHSYSSGTYILVVRTSDGDLEYKIMKE